MASKELKKWSKVPGYFSQGYFMQKLVRSADEEFPPDCVMVEIGSYLGRSTCCIAQALVSHKLVAIDPHEGILQQPGKTITVVPSYKAMLNNLKECGVDGKVEVIRKKSEDVEWDGRNICFLFIDGFHEYRQVRIDFDKFYPFMLPRSTVVFHDYGSLHYQGVTRAVDDIFVTHEDLSKPAKDRFIIAFKVKMNETNK